MSFIFSYQIYFSKTRCGARNKNLVAAKELMITQNYDFQWEQIIHRWEVFTYGISDFFKFTFFHNDSHEVIDEVHFYIIVVI